MVKSLCLTNKHYAMKTYGGSRFIDRSFLDLGTSWRWVVSFTPRPLNPQGKAPSAHWIGGWVGPRACLDAVERRKFLPLPELELRPPGFQARSQSLYPLSYPDSDSIRCRILISGATLSSLYSCLCKMKSDLTQAIITFLYFSTCKKIYLQSYPYIWLICVRHLMTVYGRNL
jgi:hypothetical protein